MKIFRRKFLLRFVASFFLLEIIANTLAPSLTFALTSGPTAPEATSFEPVDTTDMVNLATGDMVYNIPLMEVPGPSGGYPLSLSYHAGIMPNEDASWVGLGWTLNPGAITRTVNGYPDDQVDAVKQRRDVWKGGDVHSFSVGIGVPGASYGLTVSHDSNLGTGVGMTASVGFNYSIGGVGVSAGVSSGVNPFGGRHNGAYAGVKIGTAQADAQKAAISLGVSTNFKTVSFHAGVSLVETNGEGKVTGSTSLLDASISSKGLRQSIGISGIGISSNNDKAGTISTNSFGFSVPIPVGPIMVNLGYNYQRYWSDESSSVKVIGSLQTYESLNKNRNEYSFDSYSLPDPDSDRGLLKDNDPDKAKGGSFPAYDSYNVNAQGLSGSIQPYIFENGNLYRQNINRSGHNVQFKSFNVGGSAFYRKVNFRFKNDFSNTLGYLSNQMRYENSNTYFTNSRDNLTPSEGYNNTDQHLAGSKHIEWFSNNEIHTGTAKNNGFIDYKLSTDRELTKFGYDVAKQVGGFSITNESGVTYHYALPVYTYGEFSKSFSAAKPNDIYQTNFNFQPYAYTWFLTAITGPDFVDRGGVDNQGDGLLDVNDWGYWVKFDYSKHTDKYTWRNPSIGFHKDIDEKFEFYSFGNKELYYLSKVVTKTHVARFVKSERLDGKAVMSGHSGNFGIDQFIEYTPIENCDPSGCVETFPGECDNYCVEVNYIDIPPQSTLKLDAIELYTAQDYSDVVLPTQAVRTVILNSDYSLCPETPNSFDNGNVSDKRGKLTLKSLSFNGKAGVSGLLPPIKFEYDLGEGFSQAEIRNNSQIRFGGYDFKKGDLLKASYQNLIGYYLVEGLNANESQISFLGGDRLPDNNQWIPITISKTKNPPFNGDAQDIWGFYKSDYKTSDIELVPFTTELSSNNVDVWSLRKIRTSLGSTIQINYESDSFNKNVLNIKSSFQISEFVRLSEGLFQIKVNQEVNLKDYYSINDVIDFSGMGFHFAPDRVSTGSENNCRILNPADYYYFVESKHDDILVTYVSENIIRIQSQKIEDDFNDNTRIVKDKFVCCSSNCNNTNYIFRSSSTIHYDGYVDSFIGGFISSDVVNKNKVGGGIRVSKISLIDQSSLKRTTSYNYANGTTSYEPYNLLEGFVIPVSEFDYENAPADFNITLLKNKLAIPIQNNVRKQLIISREVPAPGVIYEYVTAEEELEYGVNDLREFAERKVFEFEVFHESYINRTGMISTNEAGAVTCYNDIGERVPCNPTFDEDCQNSEPNTRPCSNENRPTECYDVNGNSVSCGAGSSTIYSPMTIDDYSSFVGSLKSIRIYGAGNELISETMNHYLHDNKDVGQYSMDLKQKFNNQGKITQIYNEYRDVNGSQLRVFSRRNEYPLVLVGQSQFDYKTATKKVSENKAFDFFTGAPTRVLTSDAYGNTFLTETKAAYNLPEYSGSTSQQIAAGFVGMGLKVNNIKNKHMLTQEAYTTTFKVDPATLNRLSLVSASSQTWSDQTPAMRTEGTSTTQQAQTGIWRKKSNHSFVGDATVASNADGFINVNAFTEFTNWTSDEPNTGWQKNSEITLYDVYSHGLEAKDMNNMYAATKHDSKFERIFTTAANARYNEFAYSGAEDEQINQQFGGGVEAVSAVSTTKAHTGSRSVYAVNTGTAAFRFTATAEGNRSFVASVWSDRSDGVFKYSINNGATQTAVMKPAKQAGQWYLLTTKPISVADNSQLKIWSEASTASTYFDDFRVHPFDAAIVSYVYNSWGELSHILDANNLFTEYRYDKIGRLEETYRETFSNGVVRINSVEYHYKSGNGN